MTRPTIPSSIEEAGRKMSEEAFPYANPFQNKLRRWIKYCLWTAIYANIAGASKLSDAFVEVASSSGRIFAGIMVLFILLLLGTTLGTILWGAGILGTKLLSIPPKHIPTRYVIGLFTTVVLLANLGNLQTLILVILYQVGVYIYDRYSTYKATKKQTA